MNLKVTRYTARGQHAPTVFNSQTPNSRDEVWSIFAVHKPPYRHHRHSDQSLNELSFTWILGLFLFYCDTLFAFAGCSNPNFQTVYKTPNFPISQLFIKLAVILLNLSRKMERHDHDVSEAGIRSLVFQTERPQPLSQLQKWAPAKLELKRLSLESIGLSCKSPIPLLSPLVMSPLDG